MTGSSGVRENGKRKSGILSDLLLTFMKIGAFTFGGGYAMISLMEDLCVERKRWITHDDMMNVIVIAESTPGPIAINCATFVGYRQGGYAGAVVATLGIVLPSFCILYAISMFFEDLLEITVVAHAFKGIAVAVGILIFDAGVSMVRRMRKKALPLAIAASSWTVMLLVTIFSWKLSSVTVMLVAAALSLAVFMTQKRHSGKAGETK